MTAPPGCLVNALFPSPIGVRYADRAESLRRGLGRPRPGASRPNPRRAGGRISPVVASVLDLDDRPAPGPGRRAHAGRRRGPTRDGRDQRRRFHRGVPAQHAGREHRGRGADRHASLSPDPRHGRGGRASGRPRRPARLPGVPPARHRDGARDGAMPPGAVGRGGRARRHLGKLRGQPRHAASARHRQGRRAPPRARRSSSASSPRAEAATATRAAGTRRRCGRTCARGF